MVTLIISIIILLIGYFVYSKYIERVFGADGSRATPAVTMTDGVDYIPMPFEGTKKEQTPDLQQLQQFPVFIQPTLKCFQSTCDHSQQSGGFNQHTGNPIQSVLEYF